MAEIRRTKLINFLVSEEEHAALTAKAKEADMSMSSFLRDHIGTAVIRHRADEKRRHAVLNRINANLNMIAKWANTYKGAADALPVTHRLLMVEAQIDRLIQRLDRMT